MTGRAARHSSSSARHSHSLTRMEEDTVRGGEGDAGGANAGATVEVAGEAMASLGMCSKQRRILNAGRGVVDKGCWKNLPT